MTATDARLADALEDLGAPPRMVRRARRGYYSDVQSDSQTPKNDLVTELNELGLTDLAARVTAGEFNDTIEDIKEWFRSKEGFMFLREHFPAITRTRWNDVFRA